MIKYDLTLERQRLIGADKFSIAANANETVCLYFHFDRSWRRFDSKAAVFRNSASKYYIIEIKADRVKVPWEVLTDEGGFELSVIGFEGEKVITSDKVEILVTESLLPEDCKTFSPSEVLFDRFRRECIAQAYLDYEDELKALKTAHAEEKMTLGEQINQANERTQEIIKEKNDEIELLNIRHNNEKANLNNTISDLNSEMLYYKEKAEKWDKVNYAVSLKNMASQSLWAGGNQPFSLPMMDTKNVSAFVANSFSQYLTEIGLDLTSAKTFSGVFTSHQSIEKVELINTFNISSFANAFDNCKSIKSVSIDSMKSCTNISRFANEANNIMYINFGTDVESTSYERSFANCRLLKEINGRLNLAYATITSTMLEGCVSLEKVTFVEDTIRRSIDLVACVNLSKESMISVFEGLSSETSGTLSVSSYAFEKNFTQQERESWLEYVTETKAWVISFI